MIPKQAAVDFLKSVLHSTTHNLRVRLCKNNPSPADADIVLTDLTEATFAGYAEQTTLSWGNPSLNGSNEAELLSPVLTWTATSGITSETLYGIYVVFDNELGATKLYAFGRFTAPVTLAVVGEQVQKLLDLYAWNGVP